MEQLINVLIVEDDPMVLELNRQYVGQVQGFEIIGCAQDAALGMELITDLNPQLVILDVYMSGNTGLELLRQIRNLGLNTDAILVTAAHDSRFIQAGMRYGVVDYIIKPFSFQRFKKSLMAYRQYLDKFKTNPWLSQKDIDGLNVLKNMDSFENIILDGLEAFDIGKELILGGNLPKGLDKSTLRFIIHKVREQKDYFTAEQISKIAGVSRVTARRYLNYLYDSGWLKSVLSYGPVGRPLHKYIVNGTLVN